MKGFGPPVQYCPYGGKVMYDKKGAVTAKNKRWEDSHTELRIYPCPNCNHWHLTKILYYKKSKKE